MLKGVKNNLKPQKYIFYEKQLKEAKYIFCKTT